MQHLWWSSSVLGVLCRKSGVRFELAEQVKVVLNLRSAPLNKKSIFCKDKFEAKFGSLFFFPFFNKKKKATILDGEKHVNTTTDKRCVLGIRTVPRLARIWTHWQLFLFWTPNVTAVCTVVWISSFALMSCWEPQRKQLFYQWDY